MGLIKSQGELKMEENETMEFTNLSLEKETIADWLDQLEIAQEFIQNKSDEVSELLDPVINFFTDVLENGDFKVFTLKDIEKAGGLRMIEKEDRVSPAGRA
jgi:hypothetical protein